MVHKLVHKNSASGFITQLLDKSVGSDVLFKNVLSDGADFVFFKKKVGKIFVNLTKLRGKLRLRRS